jgi:hypothetical protein
VVPDQLAIAEILGNWVRHISLSGAEVTMREITAEDARLRDKIEGPGWCISTIDEETAEN